MEHSRGRFGRSLRWPLHFIINGVHCNFQTSMCMLLVLYVTVMLWSGAVQYTWRNIVACYSRLNQFAMKCPTSMSSQMQDGEVRRDEMRSRSGLRISYVVVSASQWPTKHPDRLHFVVSGIFKKKIQHLFLGRCERSIEYPFRGDFHLSIWMYTRKADHYSTGVIIHVQYYICSHCTTFFCVLTSSVRLGSDIFR